MSKSIKIFTGVTFLILSACVMDIGSNMYKTCTKEQLTHFKPAEASSQFSGNDTLNLSIYELNSKEIKKRLVGQKYTWIHMWRPYCKADYCENINYPKNVSSKRNIQFFLLSQVYDLVNIRKSLGRTVYDQPVYVIQNSSYKMGTKMNGKNKAATQMRKELNNNPKLTLSKWGDDLFFKDTVLIYASEAALDANKIDSLLNIYK